MFSFSGILIMITFLVILFWVIVAIGIVFLINYLINYNRKESEEDSEEPITILKTRLAKGEIDEKEFETKREKLEK